MTRFREEGVEAAPDNECEEKSPGGWYCCLPKGHDGNHIGTTMDYGKLFQWPQSSSSTPRQEQP